MLGWIVFFGCSALALFAASAIARLGRYSSIAEHALATSMLWSVLILAPIHFLGVTNRLTPVALAAASLATSVGALLLTARREHAWSANAELLWAMLRLPIDALSAAWRARSLIFLGLLVTFGVLAWTSYISYLAPSDAWDGIWYHETMIGYAIQNHGYELASLPANLSAVNSFPRNCEMTSLWFVIFTDRRLIDAVNDLYTLPAMLAVYCICKRYVGDKTSAMGWACALVMTPGFFLQLHSNLIDIHVVAIFLASLHFATRPSFRRADAWMAIVSLGLLLGGKYFAVAWVPLIGLIVLVRISLDRTWSRRTSWLTILGGIGVIVLLGGFTYLRNWIAFRNPMWPYQVDLPLGIHFHGPELLSGTDFNRSFAQVIRDSTAPPKPGYDYGDTRQFGYGLAIPFFILPMSAVAFSAALIVAAKSLLERLTTGQRAGDSSVYNLLLTVFPPLSGVISSRALWLTRYNYHVIAAMFFLLAWLSGRRGFRRVGEASSVLCVVTGVMWLYWASPAWLVTKEQVDKLATLPAWERATETTIGWSISPIAARARELELAPGDIVAYSDDIEFPAVLWNEHFSNRVIYVPAAAPDAMLKKLDQLGAKWFITNTLNGQVEASGTWQLIGPVSGHPTMAYRRVRG